MSVSKWAYSPEKCDGKYCPGSCDDCRMANEDFVKTPHIALSDNIGFGKTVLMPGDPLRAKRIAETFLENAVPVNTVRGVNGYTGYYKGIKVSVMASGMGMPSIGIYSEELYKFFGVDTIIRVGSIGAINKSLRVGDVIAATAACTNSNFYKKFGLDGTVAPVAPAKSLRQLFKIIDTVDFKVVPGPVFSSDIFYNEAGSATDWDILGCLGVEMETAALYLNAMRFGKGAMAINTVSDLCFEPFTAATAEEREKNFEKMTVLALEMAILNEKE